MDLSFLHVVSTKTRLYFRFVSILVLMDLSFLPALTFKPVFFNGFVYILHSDFCTV